jgi:COMPASS component SPP1
MQTRLDAWAKKGGKKDKLWESVKNAEKREGIVISADNGIFRKDENDADCKHEVEDIKPRQTKAERELERLTSLLDQVVRLREHIKKGMEVVVWRERLIALASERAEQVDQCGWDQRLCFGDDEWADFGAGVLESYEDVKTESNQGDMQVDGVSEELGEWWCPGKKMCDRHAGWATFELSCRRR